MTRTEMPATMDAITTDTPALSMNGGAAIPGVPLPGGQALAEPDSSDRTERIARCRCLIASGDYETDDRLDAAVARLAQRLTQDGAVEA